MEESGAKSFSVGAEDVMRADIYALLGRVLFASPDQSLLNIFKNLSGDATPMGEAFRVLRHLAETCSPKELSEEYDALFIGMGRGELLPYGSYYLTGFLNEKPLARLRASMRDLSIGREENVSEPEDHIAIMCEMMSGLILGKYSEPADIEVQHHFFTAHIESWAWHFFRDLETAKSSRFYQPVGTIGKLFMEIEAKAFSMGNLKMAAGS